MLLRLTPLLILLGLTWAQPRPNRFQSNNTSLLKYLHKDPPNNRAAITNEPATGKRVLLKSAKPLVDISRNRLVPLNTTKPVPSPVVITLKQNRQHSSRHGQAGIDIENPRPNVPAKLVKKITQDSSPTTSTKIENTRLNGLAKLVKKNKQDSSPSTSNKISPLPPKLKMKQNNTDNSSRVISSNKTKLAPMSLKLKNKQIRDKDQQTSRPLSSDITKLSLISSKLKTKRTSNDVEKSSTLNSPTMNSNNSPMKPFMKFNKILESTNSKKNPLNNPSDVSAAKTSLNNVSFPNLKKVVVQDQNIKQQISSKIRLTTKPTIENERKRIMPADIGTSSNFSRGQKNVKFTSARDSHQAVANVSGL